MSQLPLAMLQVSRREVVCPLVVHWCNKQTSDCPAKTYTIVESLVLYAIL